LLFELSAAAFDPSDQLERQVPVCQTARVFAARELPLAAPALQLSLKGASEVSTQQPSPMC
jgi:hypothetical protein